MRANASVDAGELRLALHDVEDELRDAVAELAFAPDGAAFVRTFPADAPHAEAAACRFVTCAERLVRQCARLEPVPWEDALATLIDRAGTDGWWLVGSAALAVRGARVEPRDLDVISDADGCVRIADALADRLVEPLAGGGYLGEWWLRAFAGARIECVGGVHASVEPADFGPAAAARLDTVQWRGHRLRVPPLDLQLQVSERRGLDDRVRAIRELLP
jgi:hypothetical protein